MGISRRLILSVALVSLAVMNAFAAERGTFILTDGERKSGTIVFHGDQHENLINGYLNLGVDNGKDMTFPLGQVAVIDFIGGQPPTTELAQLGQGHTLVTRNGATQQGRLINMTGGDTLLWENLARQRQQYAIRDVSRVYLNTQSAYTAFGYTPPAPAVTAPVPAETGRNPRSRGNQNSQGDQGNPRSPRSRGDQGSLGNQNARRDQDTDARGITVRVDPRQGWTDSGLTVNRGDRLVFETSSPVPGLIGRIGNGAAFVIGADRPSILMRASGPLLLNVDDDEYRDNPAAFSVRVSRP